jgi:hypothetical protein
VRSRGISMMMAMLMRQSGAVPWWSDSLRSTTRETDDGKLCDNEVFKCSHEELWSGSSSAHVWTGCRHRGLRTAGHFDVEAGPWWSGLRCESGLRSRRVANYWSVLDRGSLALVPSLTQKSLVMEM